MRLTIVGLRGASWGFVGLRGASWDLRGASWDLGGGSWGFVEPSWLWDPENLRGTFVGANHTSAQRTLQFFGQKDKFYIGMEMYRKSP